MKTKSLLSTVVTIVMLGTLIPTALAATGFSDVTEEHANYTSIMDLQERGIIEGYEDGTFKPDQTVNRVEALKIILLGAEVDTTQTNGVAEFTDTDIGAWYAPFINKAVSLEIVDGYPDGSFKPAQTINLVEALKVVQLTNNIDLADTIVSGNPYADAFSDLWYSAYVQYAKDKNIIEADDSNNIYPSQGMTRGKIVELIYRLIWIQEMGADSYDPNAPLEPEDPVEDPVVEEPSTPTWNIVMEDNQFKLKDITIGIGATLKWGNTDNVTHTVTSDAPLFDSGDMNNGDSFEYTFDQAGTYAYHCNYHPSMTGTVTVKPANQIPTI